MGSESPRFLTVMNRGSHVRIWPFAILRELDIVANRKAQIANKWGGPTKRPFGWPKTINHLYPILIGDKWIFGKPNGTSDPKWDRIFFFVDVSCHSSLCLVGRSDSAMGLKGSTKCSCQGCRHTCRSQTSGFVQLPNSEKLFSTRPVKYGLYLQTIERTLIIEINYKWLVSK